jgi:molybdate transport system substrate-binding protein
MSFSSQAETLSISAAASLAPSLNKVAKMYRDSYSDDLLQFNYASSSVLARQIEYGAPADIYLSANKKWVDFLASKDRLLNSSIMPLFSNQLVIAKNNHKIKTSLSHACFDQKATITMLKTLGSLNQKLIVADMTHVPLGIYSKQALVNTGQYELFASKLIPSANARSALAFVEQKHANFALLYYSDAINSDLVDIVCIIPSEFHDPIHYYLAKVTQKKTVTQEKALSIERFYQFIQTDSVKRVFVDNGFLDNQL